MSHWQYAEFVPALPALGGAAELAASLFTVVLWGVALGLAIAWRYTIGGALEWAANMMDRVGFTVLGRHIRPLAPFSAELRAVDLAITKGLNKVLVGAEHATVWLFHHGLNLIVWSARETWALSRDAYRALSHVGHVVIPRALRHALSATGAFAVRLEHAIDQRAVRLLHFTRTLIHREAVAWRAGIHVLRQSIAHALPRIGRLERDATRSKSRIRRLEELVTLAGFSAFMWRWLKRYDLRWLRCGSVGRLGSLIGCGGFAFLEGLLFLAWETFAVLDLCRFADGMTRLAEEMRPLMMQFVDVEEALVGCRGATKPPNLSVPKLALPPTNAGLVLAQPDEHLAFVIAPGVLPGVGAATA